MEREAARPVAYRTRSRVLFHATAGDPGSGTVRVFATPGGSWALVVFGDSMGLDAQFRYCTCLLPFHCCVHSLSSFLFPLLVFKRMLKRVPHFSGLWHRQRGELVRFRYVEESVVIF